MYLLHARRRRKKYSSENNNGENSTYYFNETPMENFTLPIHIVSAIAADGEVPTGRPSRLSKK